MTEGRGRRLSPVIWPYEVEGSGRCVVALWAVCPKTSAGGTHPNVNTSFRKAKNNAIIMIIRKKSHDYASIIKKVASILTNH